jgi:predicted aspartyl protease
MAHVYADIVVKGTKGQAELEHVLVDTGATFTTLPADVIQQIDLPPLPGGDVEISVADGRTVKGAVYGARVGMEGVEAPAVVVTFEGAGALVGVQTLESLGLRVDPQRERLEFTRPGGIAYALSPRSIPSPAHPPEPAAE